MAELSRTSKPAWRANPQAAISREIARRRSSIYYKWEKRISIVQSRQKAVLRQLKEGSRTEKSLSTHALGRGWSALPAGYVTTTNHFINAGVRARQKRKEER